MAEKPAPPATATPARRTVLAIMGIMAVTGTSAALYAVFTEKGRRLRDLKPGPFDPLLGHITGATRLAHGLSATDGAPLAMFLQPLEGTRAERPGRGPWCVVTDKGGSPKLHQEPAEGNFQNPPFIARLVAGRRPGTAVCWMAAPGGQPEAPGLLAAWGFPPAGDPARLGLVTRHPWLAWIEGRPGQWEGRMVVRPPTAEEAADLHAQVEAWALGGLRHQRDGGDVLLGWKPKPEK